MKPIDIREDIMILHFGVYASRNSSEYEGEKELKSEVRDSYGCISTLAFSY